MKVKKPNNRVKRNENLCKLEPNHWFGSRSRRGEVIPVCGEKEKV